MATWCFVLGKMPYIYLHGKAHYAQVWHWWRENDPIKVMKEQISGQIKHFTNISLKLLSFLLLMEKSGYMFWKKKKVMKEECHMKIKHGEGKNPTKKKMTWDIRSCSVRTLLNAICCSSRTLTFDTIWEEASAGELAMAGVCCLAAQVWIIGATFCVDLQAWDTAIVSGRWQSSFCAYSKAS